MAYETWDTEPSPKDDESPEQPPPTGGSWFSAGRWIQMHGRRLEERTMRPQLRVVARTDTVPSPPADAVPDDDAFAATPTAECSADDAISLPPPRQPTEAAGVAPGIGLDVLLAPKHDGRVLSRRQWVCIGVIAVGLLLALTVSAVTTVILVNGFLVAFFIATNVIKLVLADKARRDESEIVVGPEQLAALRDDELPVYTILLPLYHEASVVHQLVGGLTGLDYPQSRLDVILCLEEDDTETRDALDAIELPDCFRVVLVPDDGGPRGKPRACNYGLAHARGEFLVIYDGEDRPERDQLRKVVAAFRNLPADIVCLQAKLNYFNRTHNLLTRWFTAEYSVWFDQLLPGMQATDVAIPLGGTSNHFVTQRLLELGGWDSSNVTEDADLGLRIFTRRWKTGILNTTTYEEATSRLHNWIRQRSRWVKGYMQTYLVQMRHPLRLARTMGWRPFVVFQLFFGSCTIALLLNPIYWLLTVLWFATQMHWIQTVFPRPVLYMGTAALFIGNAACILLLLSGTFARRNYEDAKWVVLAPIYWILMSIASYKALWQLCTRPSYWEKTEHGFCHMEEASFAGDVALLRGSIAD